MMEKTMENNRVSVIGEVASEFTFSHEVYGEGFYLTTVLVNRLSNQVDEIPLMVSERLMDIHRHEGNRNRLVLSVFAREVSFPDGYEDSTKTNQIYLDGYLCKPPVYRKTPLGREIADLLIAVNRPYGKSDYIPCIAWGRNARYASGFEVGSRLRVWGRVQSREYTKKLDEEHVEKRIAYEVSVSKLESL